MKSLHDAMLDPDLFGRTFGGPTFAAWRAVAKMIDAAPLTDEEGAFYRTLSAREDLPAGRFPEVYMVKTRRSGGTLFMAAAGVHAGCIDYRDRLGPGEFATVALIASDRRQARQLMNYTKGLIADAPMIAAEVENDTTETVTFKHRTIIEVHVSSWRSVRGYSLAAVLLDELAFYRSDTSANPDIELVRALRPALATLDGRLFGFSSPHARRGHLWEMYRRHYGQPSRVLVLQATDALVLNPTLNVEIINAAREEDPEAARSEWEGQFRSDISAFLDDALIDGAIAEGVTERPFRPGSQYVAFCDPSGGRHDAMTLAIAHGNADERVTLDRLVIQPPPFDPERVVERFAELVRAFGLTSMQGDAYGGEWVPTAFARFGVKYEPAELNKSDVYAECLPIFAQKRVDLLDNPRLATELRLLERRVRLGGKGDLIDHPPRAHDDAANAACGALWRASIQARVDAVLGSRGVGRYETEYDHMDDDARRRRVLDRDAVAAYERLRARGMVS